MEKIKLIFTKLKMAVVITLKTAYFARVSSKLAVEIVNLLYFRYFDILIRRIFIEHAVNIDFYL